MAGNLVATRVLLHHCAVGGIAGPHRPAIVTRIPGFQAIQTSGVGRHVQSPRDDGRLERRRFTRVLMPSKLAGLGVETE